MHHTVDSDITTSDITSSDLLDLSKILSHRQSNPQFMKFLKEQPMTVEQNRLVLQRELESPHCLCKGIHLQGVQDIVWFLLFHCFNPVSKELELGFRVDPLLQKKWICTQAVRQNIVHALAPQEVGHIVGRHSAWNKGSFGVFRKSGFQIVDFVPQQTFLPNLGKTTDDFKRQISKTGHKEVYTEKVQQIQKGLEKHKIFIL